MGDIVEFDRYMAHLCEALGYSARNQSLLESGASQRRG